MTTTTIETTGVTRSVDRVDGIRGAIVAAEAASTYSRVKAAGLWVEAGWQTAVWLLLASPLWLRVVMLVLVAPLVAVAGLEVGWGL